MATGRVIRRNGKWAYVISMPFDPVKGKYPQRWRSGFETKAAAAEALRKDLAEIDSGEIVMSKLTTESYLLEWLKSINQSRAPRTAETYQYTVERWIVPLIGSIKLNKLDHYHIEKMYQTIAKSGIASSSVHRVHRVLRTALNRAVKRGLLARNPISQVDAPSNHIDRRETLHSEHVIQLLEYLSQHSPMLHMAVYLSVFTGMRRGELCGLTWSNVDWDHGVLRIVQARQRRDGKDLIGKTKTAGSVRPIVIDDDVLTALQNWKSEQKERAEQSATVWTVENYILTNIDGSLPDPSSFSRQLAKAVRKLNLPHVSFHDLRHTHATLLLEANVPLKVVSERLGHASIGTTANVYAHVTENMQRQAADKLKDILSKPIEH